MMAKYENKDNRDIDVLGIKFNLKRIHIIATSIISVFLGFWTIGALLNGLMGFIVSLAISLMLGGIISIACYDCGAWDNFFGKQIVEDKDYYGR